MKVLGTTDEHSGRCDCCSTRIKRAVVLETSDGNVVRYGMTCAAMATGHRPAKVQRLAFNAMHEAKQAEYASKAIARIHRAVAWPNPPRGFSSWREVDDAIYPPE